MQEQQTRRENTHKGKERKNTEQKPCHGHVIRQRKCRLNIRNPPEVRHGLTHRRLQRLQVFISQAQQRKQPGLGRRSVVECLPCMESPEFESRHHRLQGPEGQDVCCKTVSPTYDRETTAMKSQQRGCLNKT